jgi:hypothetical protein
MVVPLLAFTAQADTLCVDDDASFGGDGLSWDTAYCYLQDALVAAAASGGTVTEIRVAQGTYRPDQDEAGNVLPGDLVATFQLLNGVALRGGYAGQGTPDPNERNVELYETVLSGDLLANDGPNFTNYEDNSWHIVKGSGTDQSAEIDGFTIEAGHANGPGFPLYHQAGAGMFNLTGSPTVRRCLFVRNLAEEVGAGMFNAEGAMTTVVECTFDGNRVTPPQWGGAGMLNYIDADVTVRDCVFSNNVANWGGAMVNQLSDPTITDCIFEFNHALTSNGGGIQNYEGVVAQIRQCLFRGNTASERGGGIDNQDSSALIVDCTFIGNTAAAGGAIRNFDLSHSEVNNTIMWDNVGGAIANETGSTATVGYSDIQGGWPGPGNIDADPLFADADGRLSPGSPCIDAGNNAAVPPGLDTDLDGNPRFVDDTCKPDTGSPPEDDPYVDMGAYEFQGCSCDLNGDGEVGINDFLVLLSDWGPCADCDACPADFDGDCEVGVTDFLKMLACWG